MIGSRTRGRHRSRLSIRRSPVRGFSAKTQKGSRIQEPGTRVGEVNVTFKEPVHKILEQIKNEPYFRWLRKMGGDP